MTDLHSARIKAQRDNLKRYTELLMTELTEVERSFLHRRIAEERLALDQLALAYAAPRVCASAAATGGVRYGA